VTYGYFQGISWWPWILAASYTAVCVLIVARDTNRLPVWTVLSVGPVLFLVVGTIEAANTGILVGAGFWPIADYLLSMLTVGILTSLFSGIFAGAFISGFQSKKKSKPQ